MFHRYIIKLEYVVNGIVELSHTMKEGPNSRITNEKDFYISCGRSDRYFGIFQQISTPLKFMKKERAFMKEVYDKYCSGLTGKKQLKIYITIGGKSFIGYSRWHEITFDDFTVSVPFVQGGKLDKLLNNQDIEYKLKDQARLDSLKHAFNVSEVLRSETKILMNVDERQRMPKMSMRADTFEGKTQDPVVLKWAPKNFNESELEQYPIYESLENEQTINLFTYTGEHVGPYEVDIELKANNGFHAIFFTDTPEGNKISPKVGVRVNVWYVLSYNDGSTGEQKIFSSYISKGDESRNFTALIYRVKTTVIVDPSKLSKGGKIEIKFQTEFANDIGTTQAEIDTFTSYQYSRVLCDIEVSQRLPVSKDMLKAYNLNTVLNEYKSLSGIDFDHRVIQGETLFQDFFITTGEGLLNSAGTSLSLSVGKLFDDISKFFGIGLNYDQINDQIKIDYLGTIFNTSNDPFHLGEVDEMTIELNEIANIKELDIGGLSGDENFVWGNYEFNTLAGYETEVDNDVSESLAPKTIKTGSTYFNKHRFEYFLTGLNEERDYEGGDNPYALIANNDSGEIVPRFSPNPATWPARAGTAFGLEICGREILYRWRDYFSMHYSGEIETKRINSGKNDGMKYSRGTSAIYDCLPEKITGTSFITNPFFGPRKYEVKMKITPDFFDFIYNNKNNRFSFDYKGKTFYGWLYDIEVNLLTNKKDTIIFREATN